MARLDTAKFASPAAIVTSLVTAFEPPSARFGGAVSLARRLLLVPATRPATRRTNERDRSMTKLVLHKGLAKLQTAKTAAAPAKTAVQPAKNLDAKLGALKSLDKGQAQYFAKESGPSWVNSPRGSSGADQITNPLLRDKLAAIKQNPATNAQYFAKESGPTWVNSPRGSTGLDAVTNPAANKVSAAAVFSRFNVKG